MNLTAKEKLRETGKGLLMSAYILALGASFPVSIMGIEKGLDASSDEVSLSSNQRFIANKEGQNLDAYEQYKVNQAKEKIIELEASNITQRKITGGFMAAAGYLGITVAFPIFIATGAPFNSSGSKRKKKPKVTRQTTQFAPKLT